MQRGSMAWKSIWLQIENKPLWGRQSGPTSYYLNVPCSIQQHGRCVQVDTPGVFSSREALTGKSGCRWESWLGVCPHSLPAIWFLSRTQLPGAPVVTQAYATERKHNWTLSFASLDWEERVKCNSLEEGHRGSAQSPFINAPDLDPLPFSLSFWQPKMRGEVQPPTLLHEKGSSKVAWLEWRMCERPKSDHRLCSQACFHLLISNGGGRIRHIW